jgi:hypothetical protein
MEAFAPVIPASFPSPAARFAEAIAIYERAQISGMANEIGFRSVAKRVAALKTQRVRLEPESRTSGPPSLFWLRERVRLLRYANKKQALCSGKPALSYPRKRVSSGTRRRRKACDWRK